MYFNRSGLSPPLLPISILINIERFPERLPVLGRPVVRPAEVFVHGKPDLGITALPLIEVINAPRAILNCLFNELLRFISSH